MGTGVRVDPDSILPYSISFSLSRTLTRWLSLSLSRKRTLASGDSNLWNSTAVAHAARTHRENPRASALFRGDLSAYGRRTGGRRSRSRILCVARRARAGSRPALDMGAKKSLPPKVLPERSIIFEVPTLTRARMRQGFCQRAQKTLTFAAECELK